LTRNKKAAHYRVQAKGSGLTIAGTKFLGKGDMGKGHGTRGRGWRGGGGCGTCHLLLVERERGGISNFVVFRPGGGTILAARQRPSSWL